MRQMEADHQNQLEGISLELMHFESSLRTKENQIDTMLATKDQVPTFQHIFLSIQYKIKLYKCLPSLWQKVNPIYL